MDRDTLDMEARDARPLGMGVREARPTMLQPWIQPRDDQPMTRATVIGRRRKGHATARVVRDVVRRLEAAHWNVDSHVVRKKSALTRKASKAAVAGRDIVVIVGGDGAVLQVLPALAGTKTVLGIIPTGTGNLLAGNLRIPRDVDGAVRTLTTGRRRRIDLGRATVDGMAHPFAVACGVGFDAEVMDQTQPREKRRWGKLAYFANAVAQTRGLTNVPHEITLDGVTSTTEGAQILVANFGRMLAGLAPRRAIRPDDGLLDVIVVRASGPLSGLLAAWDVLRQTHLGESGDGRVYRAQAREATIATTPPRLVEVDGTVVGRTPITISIMPRALRVIVPAK